ncbi:hypothetical protein D9Q98_003798 [Chlorella vulgaris]|uniref:Uncharacterized protein n=1 Tax=Chlorella vulgaris TaxID=3077 RepID=A0A9D4YXH4_CHLVU|nr:hypothetical protein D9Q98_003795 [Chlorella vulgaris]KAI3432238.1 hypothetical protein D9Q98_003798 [Chlorella vulgaris]
MFGARGSGLRRRQTRQSARHLSRLRWQQGVQQARHLSWQQRLSRLWGQQTRQQLVLGAKPARQRLSRQRLTQLVKLFKRTGCSRHASAEYVLGLFVSLDEAHRVCDVLTIKAAVDVHGDLVALKLNLDLSRYTERSDFSDDEIRPHAVSFCQPHRQLYTPSATSQSLTLRA